VDLWAVVPVKERVSAKERLAPMLRPETRQALALAMLEDVLAALTATPGFAGLLVVTVDPAASPPGDELWRAPDRNGRPPRPHRRSCRSGAAARRRETRRNVDLAG